MSINIGCLLCFKIFKLRKMNSELFSPKTTDEKVDIQGGS